MVHIAKEFGSMKQNKMHAAEAWNEIQRMRIHDSPSCEFTDFKIEMLQSFVQQILFIPDIFTNMKIC